MEKLKEANKMKIKQNPQINSMIRSQFDKLTIGSMRLLDYMTTIYKTDSFTKELTAVISENAINLAKKTIQHELYRLKKAGFIKNYGHFNKKYYISMSDGYAEAYKQAHSTITIPDNIFYSLNSKKNYIITRSLYINSHVNAGTPEQNAKDIRYIYQNSFGKDMPNTHDALKNMQSILANISLLTGITFTYKKTALALNAVTVKYTYPHDYTDTTRTQRQINQKYYEKTADTLKTHEQNNQTIKTYVQHVNTTPTNLTANTDKEKINRNPIYKQMYEDYKQSTTLTESEIIGMILGNVQ